MDISRTEYKLHDSYHIHVYIVLTHSHNEQVKFKALFTAAEGKPIPLVKWELF